MGLFDDRFWINGFILSPFMFIENAWKEVSNDIGSVSSTDADITKQIYFQHRIKEYIESMNKVLTLFGDKHLEFNLAFCGKIEEKLVIEDNKYTLSETNQTNYHEYTSVLEIKGLAPEKWPRLNYVISQIWKTDCDELRGLLEKTHTDSKNELIEKYKKKKQTEFENNTEDNPDGNPPPASDIKKWKKDKKDLLDSFDKALKNISKGLEAYSKKELKDMCKARSLSHSGNVSKLIERILESISEG